jgi:hypothetical protein
VTPCFLYQHTNMSSARVSIYSAMRPCLLRVMHRHLYHCILCQIYFMPSLYSFMPSQFVQRVEAATYPDPIFPLKQHSPWGSSTLVQSDHNTFAQVCVQSQYTHPDSYPTPKHRGIHLRTCRLHRWYRRFCHLKVLGQGRF